MKEILIIGIVQCLLFLFLTLQKKNKQKHDWILFFWLGGYLLQISFLFIQNFINDSIVFENLAKVFSISYAPLILLYTQTLINGKLPKRLMIHFIPFIILICSSFLITENQKSYYKAGLLILKAVVHFGYPILTLWIIKREVNRLKMERSDDYFSELKWIRIVAFLLILSISLGLMKILTSGIFNMPYSKFSDVLRFIVITIIIGYFGLKHGVFFLSRIGENKSEKSYKHSPLNHHEKEKLRTQIMGFFFNSNEYLDTTFSLDTLSKILDYPKHYLSETISTELNSSFYELVNSNRIKYAQKKIKNNHSEDLTFEAIGYESGFNSKSTFFRHFKNYTGKTPRQYKIEISTD